MSEKYCVLYGRVSSAKQEQQGSSLEVQEDLLKAYADENGFLIVKSWIQKEPATKPGRKYFGEMLEYIRANNIKHVLVENTDRLHRNKMDEAKIDELVLEGKAFHLVGENDIIAEDADEMKITMQEFKGVLARAEVRKMKKRTRQAILLRVKKGEYPGPTPLGYRNIPKTRARASEIVLTDDAPNVKKLLEKFSTGCFTPIEMVLMARNMEQKTKQNHDFELPSMKVLLQNGFYYGAWTWGEYSGTVKNNQWEPLVSKSLIEKNREVMKEMSLKYRKHTGAFHKFGGLIWCGACGRTFTTGPGGKGPHKTKSGEVKDYRKLYYSCHRSPFKDEETGEKTKCKMAMFSEPFVEEEVMRNIGLLEFDEEAWQDIKEQLFDFDTREILKAEKRDVVAKINIQDKLVDTILQDLADKGTISEAEFNKRMKKYQKSLASLNSRLEALDVELEMWTENVGQLIDIIDNIKNFKEKYEKADDRTRNQMIKLMTRKILARAYLGSNRRVKKNHSKYLDFVWSDAFQTLFETGIVKKSKDVPNSRFPKGMGGPLFTTKKNVDFLFAIL